MDKQHFLDTFRVTVPQMEQLTKTALKNGGDWSDLYFESTIYGDLLLKDGEVTSGGCHTDFGVGIKVLSGERTGYAYSENTAMKDMEAAAKAASLIASGDTGNSCNRHMTVRAGTCGRAIGSDLLYPETSAWENVRASELLPFLEKLQQKITGSDSRIVKVIARLSYSHSLIMMFNSEGELTCDSRPMGSVTASVIFSNGSRTENKTASRSFRSGAELLTGQILEGAGLQLDLGHSAVGQRDSLSIVGNGVEGAVLNRHSAGQVVHVLQVDSVGALDAQDIAVETVFLVNHGIQGGKESVNQSVDNPEHRSFQLKVNALFDIAAAFAN